MGCAHHGQGARAECSPPALPPERGLQTVFGVSVKWFVGCCAINDSALQVGVFPVLRAHPELLLAGPSVCTGAVLQQDELREEGQSS